MVLCGVKQGEGRDGNDLAEMTELSRSLLERLACRVVRVVYLQLWCAGYVLCPRLIPW